MLTLRQRTAGKDAWLPGGFVGVDIFFVISGYLITSIVFGKKAQGTFSFVSFYGSRVQRIVPKYLFFEIGSKAYGTAAADRLARELSRVQELTSERRLLTCSN